MKNLETKTKDELIVKGNEQASINNTIIKFIATLIFISLFFGNAVVSKAPIPINLLIYIFTITLVMVNWSANRNIRNSIMFIILISIIPLALNIFQPLILGDAFVRLTLTLTGIAALSSIRLRRKTLNYISSLMLILILLYFIKSFNYYDSFVNTGLYSPNGSIDTNPNTMSLIMLFAFMIADRASYMKSKLLRISIAMVSFIGIYNYGSRNALIGFLIYLVLTVLLKHFTYANRKILLTTVISIAIIFPIFYISNYRYMWIKTDSSYIFDKNLYSGRQDIWTDVINTSNRNTVLFGSNNIKILDTFPSKSLHNMYLDIGFRMGAIYLVLFILILFYLLQNNKSMSDKGFASIIVLLIYGYFESSFQTGGYPSFLMLFAFMYTRDPRFKL